MSGTVQIMLTIPRRYRDLLRTIAAEANLKNPETVVTASHLGKQIICDHLDSYLNEGKGPDSGTGKGGN